MNTKAIYHFSCQNCGKNFKLANPQPKIVCSCGSQSIEPAEKQDDHPIPCIHRGEAIRELDCNCVGKPKVYECSIHSECLSRNVSHKKAVPFIKCPKCPNRQIYKRGKIGIVHTCFNGIGGTETFIRNLHAIIGDDLVGVATISPPSGECPVHIYHGTMAIESLASSVELVLAWGIDSNFGYKIQGKCPKIWAVHHGDLASDWNSKLLEDAKSWATRITAVNPDVAKKHACYLIPNPPPPAAELPELPKWFTYYPDQRYILWNHRTSAEKGADLALQISRVLPPNWLLLFSGEKDAKLPENVINIGKNQKNSAFLRVASVSLSTAIQEGYGYSVLESILAGVPVVSRPVGIAKEPGLTRVVDSDFIGDWIEAITTPFDSKFVYQAGALANTKFAAPAVDFWQHLARTIQIPA